MDSYIDWLDNMVDSCVVKVGQGLESNGLESAAREMGGLYSIFRVCAIQKFLFDVEVISFFILKKEGQEQLSK